MTTATIGVDAPKVPETLSTETKTTETAKTPAQSHLLRKIGVVVGSIFAAVSVLAMASTMNLFLGASLYALCAKKVLNVSTAIVGGAFFGNLLVLDVWAVNFFRNLFGSKTPAPAPVKQ